MPQFRITEAVSLCRVKKPQFLHCAATSSSISLRASPSPASLHLLQRPAPPSRTAPTVQHTSHHLAHLRRSRPAFRRLHRTTPHHPFPTTSAALRHHPAQLPPSRTPLTHNSHHPAHLQRSRPLFRRLHRIVVASSSSSTNHHRRCTVEELCTATGATACSSSNHHQCPLRFCLVTCTATTRTSRRFFRCRCVFFY